jgi:hypothetical protein
MCRVGDGVTNEGDTEQDGSMAKSYSPDMIFATIDTSIAPIPRPLRRVCTGDSAKHQRAAVFGTPRQSSGTAAVYARHKKPRGAGGAPQHYACFLCKKRQNNTEQHKIDQVIADLDAPDVEGVGCEKLVDQVRRHHEGQPKENPGLCAY